MQTSCPRSCWLPWHNNDINDQFWRPLAYFKGTIKRKSPWVCHANFKFWNKISLQGKPKIFSKLFRLFIWGTERVFKANKIEVENLVTNDHVPLNMKFGRNGRVEHEKQIDQGSTVSPNRRTSQLLRPVRQLDQACQRDKELRYSRWEVSTDIYYTAAG